MKTQTTFLRIMLALSIMLAFPACSVHKDQHSEKKIQDDKFYSANEADEVKEPAPYKVIRSTATVKYTIRKIGTGNSVLFSVNNGLRYLPEIVYTQNNGFFYRSGKKEGFQDVSFPFKCSLNCPVNYMVNAFEPLPALINDFEIEIYEPGNWEISF